MSLSIGLEHRPKLRFPEFDESWNPLKFGNIIDEFNDKTKTEDEDILLSAAIEGMFLNTELFGHQRGASNKGYKKIKKETLILSTQNLHLGNANVNTRFEHGMVSPAYKTYKLVNCDPILISHWIKSEKAKQFFFDATTVGASQCRRNVEWDTLYSQLLYLPSNEEQKKLADFLSLIEQKIQKQHQLVELLKKYKKGLLLSCLPENNKTNPTLRFEQFHGKWIPKNLGEIVEITMGQSPDGKTYSSIPSDYILIQGNADLKNGWVFPRIWTTQITKMAQKGDLIMSVRAPAGAMGKTAYDAVIGRGVAAIKGNEFVYQTLIKMDLCGYWKKLSTGSTFESLNSENIKSARVMLPSIQEQNYIGEFLSKIDEYINYHEKKLELLDKMKKSLLQQLFI